MRRFPPPSSTEVTPNCFIVRDANGQAKSHPLCSVGRDARKQFHMTFKQLGIKT
jgi:hypothetical protein